MKLIYKKKDGSTFTCWYNSFCNTLEVMKDYSDESNNPVIQLPEENKGWDKFDCRFEYEGETFNFKDFQASTVEELVEHVHQVQKESTDTGCRPWISEDEALCTFLKYSDKVGILAKVECFCIAVPGLGFGLKGSGSKIARALLVPCEDRYSKSEWSYKIDLKSYDEDKYRDLIGREHLYFSDLWSMIVKNPDIYCLVNLETYLSQEDPIIFEYTDEVH